MKTSPVLQTLGLTLATGLVLAGWQYAMRSLGTYDVGPHLLLLFIVHPVTALLLGIVAGGIARRWWAALCSSLVVFVFAVFAWYNASALVYVPVYVVASMVGYAISRGRSPGPGRPKLMGR
ncbi:MAG: hypothetical protein ACYC5M_03085 [Anaerolineae bacterium]